MTTAAQQASTPQLVSKLAESPQNQQRSIEFGHLLTGSIAGTLSRSITHPLERLRIMQQVGDVNYVNRGAISSFVHMYRTEGVRGLWKSNVLNCALAAPFSAFEFFFYEFYKNILFGEKGNSITLSEKIVAGALTGLTTQGLIYPGDVIKTHYITATNAIDAPKVGVW